MSYDLSPPVIAPARYRAFGLRIHSEIPLPEMAPEAPGDALPDVTILRGPPLDETGRTSPEAQFQPGRAEFFWPAVGRFTVTAPGRIEASAAAGVSDELLAFPLLGPVLATLLHMRGLFLLHASAITMNGRDAIVLAGDKGAGKSTTAAALCHAGHAMLSDDIVALGDEAPPAVLPAWNQMKLSAEAAAHLAPEASVTRGHVHDDIPKLRILMPGEPPAAAVPLARVYTLKRDSAVSVPQIRPLSPPQALALTLRYAYMARFHGMAPKGEAERRSFRQASALAGQVTMGELLLPVGIDRLPAVADVIAADLASSRRGAP
ncbi:serine kinase [Pseudoroseicyclus tamaricis]|uniref:Serine kinase n=1 Tax=Pseudoroseicyclus tamaricis TaxID=2705421 RepID=A0A6B2JSY5_9RHOB|nr:serine kinase [Pseudoroseicyclus tamaricis]NDV01348.1 serine kinase [Pseudoroseicyclus tamaricis]